MRDLQNQIASQRVAVDTAQAQAEAAEARANGAYDLALQALAASDANASDIAALNQVVQLLSAARRRPRCGAAPARWPPRPSTSPASIATPATSRTSASSSSSSVATRSPCATASTPSRPPTPPPPPRSPDLEARVAALESEAARVLRHDRAELPGRPHARRVRLRRRPRLRRSTPPLMGNSAFSTGTADLDGDNTVRQRRGRARPGPPDIVQQDGNVVATLTLNVTGGNNFDGTGSPRGLNGFTAVAEIDVEPLHRRRRHFTGRLRRLHLPRQVFTTTFDPSAPSRSCSPSAKRSASVHRLRLPTSTSSNGYVATCPPPTSWRS
jgi:hypothetical protein